MGRPKSSLISGGILSYNEKCLIVCSGSAISSALLYLIKASENRTQRNNQTFKNCLLYIDGK